MYLLYASKEVLILRINFVIVIVIAILQVVLIVVTCSIIEVVLIVVTCSTCLYLELNVMMKMLKEMLLSVVHTISF